MGAASLPRGAGQHGADGVHQAGVPGTGTTSVTYDPVGNVATATDSTGTVTYGYDDANELTSVTEPAGAKTTFEYNNDGKRTKTTFPGGTTQTAPRTTPAARRRSK
ncbi:MAG: hypothetical protein ACJ736_38840 [Streptomyces sp.]